MKIDIPFETKPPRLKELVDEHLMGDVWIRDTPFGPVTDTLLLSKKFGISHSNILRAVERCQKDLATELKFELCNNLIDNSYLSGPRERQRTYRKVDITEFGLALLLLYINSPKARRISAEIIYRFFVLRSYVIGLKPNQLVVLKGHYRKKIK